MSCVLGERLQTFRRSLQGTSSQQRMVDLKELQWQVTVLSTTFKAQFTPPSPVALINQYPVRHTSRTLCVPIATFRNSVHISPTRLLCALRKRFTTCSDFKLSIVHLPCSTIVTQTRLHFRHVELVFDLPQYYYMFPFLHSCDRSS